ncbi:S1C family serine protease [Mesorhizobium sp. M1380]|uniref:serine protease n=1 Tax=Mesorhizobium sp. M1380 TaxID=2957093 RepID=UPI003334F292
MDYRTLLVIATTIFTLSAFEAKAANVLGCLYDHHGESTAYIHYHFKDAAGSEDDIEGSGFVISSRGIILTAGHVVRPPSTAVVPVQETIQVWLGGKAAGNGPFNTSNPHRIGDDLDLAWLLLPAKAGGWASMPVGDSNRLTVGDSLTAMGYPLQGDLAMVPTAPVTSLTAQLNGKPKEWWQTALALNPGDSGGPVFDDLGNVVGVSVAIKDGAQLISFVIPIQFASEALQHAGVKLSPAGPCGTLPECADASHGIDHYGTEVPEERWSEWRGGGYNQNAFCNDFMASLKARYPDSILTKVSSDEKSRRDGDFNSHVSYSYYCKFLRQENPIYKTAAGVECLNKTP